MFIQPHFYNYFSPEGGGYFASERVQKIHHLPVFLSHETKRWDLIARKFERVITRQSSFNRDR